MLKQVLKELKIEKKFFRIDEAWVGDVQGKRSGKEKASEQEWVKKAGERQLRGYKLFVRKGTSSVLMDKIYQSKEEAMLHAKVLKLSPETTSTVPVYESVDIISNIKYNFSSLVHRDQVAVLNTHDLKDINDVNTITDGTKLNNILTQIKDIAGRR